MKRVLLCSLMLVVLLFQAFAEPSPVLAHFNGKPIEQQEVLSTLGQLLKMRRLKDETDVNGALDYLLYTQKPLEYAYETYAKPLSESEQKEARALAEQDFAASVQKLVATARQQGKEQDDKKLQALAVEFLKSEGTTLESLAERRQKAMQINNLLSSVPFSATEADIQKVFDENVQKDREAFAKDIRRYEFYAFHRGMDIWYTPAGYRRCILVSLTPEKTTAGTDPRDVLAPLQDKIEQINALLQAPDTAMDSLKAAGFAPQDIRIHKESTLYPDALIDAAFALTKDAPLAAPVVDKTGVHLMRYVEDVAEGPVPMTEAVAASITNYLSKKAQSDQIAAWAREVDIQIDHEAVKQTVQMIKDQKTAAEQKEMNEINQAIEEKQKGN